MAIPTSRFPTWATDGGADVTDPGSSKQATGWVEGEAPAADHTNWLHNARGEWLEFILQLSLPAVIGTNLVDKNTSPFGTDVFGSAIVWEPTQEKFYASIIETASQDWLAYESDDGISWSSATPVNYTDTSIHQPAPIAYCPDNNKIGAASEAGFHLSSIWQVGGFSTTPTGTFAAINVASTGLVWDDTNNLWIACGESTPGDGAIETATAAGSSWTSRDTDATAVATSMAHDRAGQTVVTYAGTDLIHYSSNGTTWSQQTTGMSKTFTRVWWCPFASVFVAYNTTSLTVYWSADGDVWALCPWGSIVDMVVCENFLVFTDTVSQQLHLVGSVDAIKGDAAYINMGMTMSYDDLAPVGTTRLWTGGDTAFSYYNTNETLVNCTFR